MFCFGVLFGPLALQIPQLAILIVLVCLLLSIAIVPKKKERLLLIALFLLVFGVFRYSQSETPKNIQTLLEVAEQSIRVRGIVSSEIENQVFSKRVVLKDVKVADKSYYGKMLVYIPMETKVSYQDNLVFNCSLKAPEQFNGFRYDKYLETKSILSICYYPNYLDVIKNNNFSIIASILSIKEKTNKQLAKILTEPHSSFLSGLIFGGSSSLSKELKDDFSRTGTSHILAASGFNVSLFSFVFLGWIIQTRLGRKRGIYLTAILLLFYVVMAGMGPAVVRATMLAFVILIGAIVGRKTSTGNALLFAGSVILLANPRLLLDDVGFQLSFVATWAIMFFVPLWRDRFLFIPESFGLREAFVGSLAAIVATLPIIIFHFGSISIIAPLTNLIILPFIPYTIAFLSIALFVSIISIQVGIFFALPAWALSFIILHIIKYSSSLPFASLSIVHNKEIGLAVATVMLLILFSVYGKTRHFHISTLV